jgi:hypothetical protein
MQNRAAASGTAATVAAPSTAGDALVDDNPGDQPEEQLEPARRRRFPDARGRLDQRITRLGSGHPASSQPDRAADKPGGRRDTSGRVSWRRLA